MKERITAAELKAMTMKELAAWVEFNACAINRTMEMSWGHEELFKNYHIRPEYIGWKAGRLIVKAFHFTSRTRKADAQRFAEWLHWAIFGKYPAEETEETEEAEATTEAAETEAEAETIEENAEEAKEVATMKKYFKVTFEYAEGIYCTNLAHAETAEDVEREYSKYPWQSVKEAQPWDVEEAKMKGMPIIEVEAAPAEDPEAVTMAPAEDAQVWDENGETVTPDTDTEEEEEEETMLNTFTPAEAAMHAATVRGIIRRKGGYRERDILNRPHTVERGETWNEAHKVVEILATTPDPDGYRPGCAVDIVTRAIVG